MTKKGNISADEATYRTSLEGVFAVGDATNKGASIAIEPSVRQPGLPGDRRLSQWP